MANGLWAGSWPEFLARAGIPPGYSPFLPLCRYARAGRRPARRTVP